MWRQVKNHEDKWRLHTIRVSIVTEHAQLCFWCLNVQVVQRYNFIHVFLGHIYTSFHTNLSLMHLLRHNHRPPRTCCACRICEKTTVAESQRHTIWSTSRRHTAKQLLIKVLTSRCALGQSGWLSNVFITCLFTFHHHGKSKMDFVMIFVHILYIYKYIIYVYVFLFVNHFCFCPLSKKSPRYPFSRPWLLKFSPPTNFRKKSHQNSRGVFNSE